MGLRDIVVDDVWWVIFEIPPDGQDPQGCGGWLCAQSLSDRRRIEPAPRGWEGWPDADLARLIRDARPLPPLPLP